MHTISSSSPAVPTLSLFGLLVLGGLAALRGQTLPDLVVREGQGNLADDWRRTTRGWEPAATIAAETRARVAPIRAVHPAVVMGLQLLLCGGAFLLWPETSPVSRENFRKS